MSAASDTSAAAQPITGWRARLATLAVGSAMLLQFVDQTALTTALPTLARSMHTDPVHLKLTLTAYMLVQAVVVPASGWASDRFGPRRVFIVAMITFLAGSVLCGLSRSLGTLVLCRMLQGVGAATMTPVGRMIVIGSTPREQLVKAMVLFTTPAVIGPILGPPLTGYILSIADWPWIFYINVPIGILGMAAVMAFVPRLKLQPPGPFDYSGFLLAGAAVLASMSVTETLGFSFVPWQAQVGVAVLAAAAIAGFVMHARRAAHPILDLSLVRVSSFRISMVGGIFARIAFGAQPFLLPLLLQVALGWSPLKAGSVMIAGAFGSLFVRAMAPTVIRRAGYRISLTLCSAVSSLLCLIPPFYRADTSPLLIMGVLFLSGMFGSCMFVCLNTVAYAETTEAEISGAATLYAVVQQIALSLGITVGALLLHIARGGGGTGALTPQGFLLPFAAICGVGLCSIPIFLRLHPMAGDNLRGGGGPRGDSGEAAEPA